MVVQGSKTGMRDEEERESVKQEKKIRSDLKCTMRLTVPAVLFRKFEDGLWFTLGGLTLFSLILSVSSFTVVIWILSQILFLLCVQRERIFDQLRQIFWLSFTGICSTNPSAVKVVDERKQKVLEDCHVLVPLPSASQISTFSYPLEISQEYLARVARGDLIEYGHVRYFHMRARSAARGTIVLLHGVSMTCDVWSGYMVSLVEEGWDVLCFDFWGHGDSAVPITAHYTPFFLSKQLASLLATLQLNGSIHLIGFSLGCLVATIFATENEEKVLSLTLIAPAAGVFVLSLSCPSHFLKSGLNKKDEDFRSKHVSLNLLQKGLSFYANFPFVSALATPLGGFVLKHLSSLLSPTSEQLTGLYRTQDSALERSALMQYINSFRFLAALWLTQHQRCPRQLVLQSFVCEGNLLADNTRLLQKLSKEQLPALLIFGEKDKLVPPTVMQRCKELFPHAHVFVAREAGHNVILHAQRPVARRIIEFLNEKFAR